MSKHVHLLPCNNTLFSPATPLLRKRFLSAVVAVTLCTLTGNTFADSDDSEDADAEVVITATRLEEKTSKVGSSITVISAEEIAQKQHRTVIDALRDVPGITIRRSGGLGAQTSIFMRGTDSDHTLLMIDGVPIHDVASPNGSAVLDHLTLDGVDRIEVVRGPQSTLYGSDAIGGVINIITEKGKSDPKHSISAEMGSYETFIERITSRGGFEKFNYSVSATRIDRDGFSSKASDNEDDRYGSTALSARLGYQLTEEFGVNTYIRHIESDIQYDAGVNPSHSKSDSEQLMLKVEPYLTLMDGKWNQKLSIWSHEINRSNSAFSYGFFDSAASRYKGENMGIDWQHNIKLSENNTLTVGVEFEDQEMTVKADGSSKIKADTHSTGYYVQDAFTLGENFTSTLGLRIDDHEEYGSETTYRATAAYDFTDFNTILRGSVGTGFKAPSLAELFDDSFGSNNPDLEPEESIGFDIGIEHALMDGDLVIGVTYFENDIDDMIVNIEVAPFTYVNSNIEEVETSGIESFIRYQATEDLSLRLHYTYTDTEAKEAASFGIEDGSQLLRRPRNKAGLDVNYRFYENRANANVSFLYVDEWQDVDSSGTVTADDYFLVGLAGSFQVNEMIEVYGRIDNLLDEDYEEVVGFNATGFAVFGGVKVSF